MFLALRHYLENNTDSLPSSLLPLKSAQCERLVGHHIYMVPNGRITISGLSAKSLDRFVKALDSEVRQS